MDPTHPHGQVENATAPSAGGFPIRSRKKDRWRNKIGVGVAIGIGIDGRVMGIGHEKPGSGVAVLTQLGSVV